MGLTGCGATYHLQEFRAAEGEPATAFVDIKQRAIFTGSRPSAVSPGNSNPTAGGSDRVVCAEPSPEGLASALTEFAGKAQFKDIFGGSGSMSRQEADSFIGLRTQTIQLLRDGMYRLCEAYLSGTLDRATFGWMTRRYQKYMVALLTIEQLTQVAQAPAMAQSLYGGTGIANSIDALLGKSESITIELAALAERKSQDRARQKCCACK